MNKVYFLRHKIKKDNNTIKFDKNNKQVVTSLILFTWQCQRCITTL